MSIACYNSMMSDFVVAIGANQPQQGRDLASTVPKALANLEKRYPVFVKQVSRIFKTPAWPMDSGPDFVNAAALVQSKLPTSEILSILHKVEEDFGRTRDVRWGPRSLDLDLIFRENQILPDRITVKSWMDKASRDGVIEAPDQLILPHPRLHERAFVLVPAHDVAPAWEHPLLGKNICTMLQDLPPEDVASVIAIA